MENNNSIEIRKYINLVESINSKLLSNKGNDFLISESNYYKKLGLVSNDIAPLLQDMFSNAQTSKLLMDKNINNVEKLTALVNNDFKKLNSASGVFSVDEIKELRKAFEFSILRSSKANKNLIDAVTNQLVQNNNWKKKYNSIGSEVDLVNALKKEKDPVTGMKKYSDQSAKSLAKKHFANKGKKSKPVDPNKPDPDPKPTDPKPDDPSWWEKIKKIGWKGAIAAAIAAGIGGFLLWYWFKQNKIEDEDFPPVPPIDPNNEWAPCLVKILENKKGIVIKVTSGKLVVKVINNTYPEGVLFFADGKVLTNDGKRKGTWKCKEGNVQIKDQPVNEQSTGSNLSADVEKIISYLKGNVINSGMLTNVKNILNTYNKSGQGKQLLSAYKRISGEFLENTLQSKTTLNDPSERKIRNEIYTIIKSVKGSGGTSTGDPLDGIEIIWDDDKKKKDDDGDKKPPKDTYRDCPNFPLYFGCKGPLVSELQTCLKMTGVDGKLGPNTMATAEAWGKSNNIELKEKFPGGGGRFEVTEENFKKICGGKPVPEIVTPTPNPNDPKPTPTPNPNDPTPTPTPKPEEPVIPTPDDTTKKLVQELIRNSHLEQRRKNKWVYRGPDLTPEQEQLLIKYFKGAGFEPKSANNAVKDWRRGDKIVFKRTGSYDEE
jgi:hypothetical protein